MLEATEPPGRLSREVGNVDEACGWTCAAVHPSSRTDHDCTPRSSHAIYLRTCTSPSPHHVCIQNNKCVSPAPGVILAAELVLALQADQSLPHATHARWFTASRCVSLCVAHSLVMAPLLLSMKSAIAAVQNTFTNEKTHLEQRDRNLRHTNENP